MTAHTRPTPSGSAFPPSNKPWTVRRKTAPTSIMPPLSQRYDVSWLDDNGMVDDFVRMGPAVPLFTQAFTALVRGGILNTSEGPVAVEDVLPGMEIETASGPATLLWKGAHTVLPGAKGKPLFRLPTDSMGLGRPAPDLILGSAARIVSRRSSLRSLIGAEEALLPVGALADGQSVVQITPISAVQCFHLGFERHQTFRVNGIDVESVHPGHLDPALGDEMQRLYISMFPHISRPEDFGELAMPRLSDEQTSTLIAA
ncbi:Hint domain-containing protein [Maribius pontilimi]|uniref:Hint domain-containing protein n=1 Tax=Palleronia pontilimi TaxID=1964209 RepID=A0A934M8A4_9RHOB|nr:Hint domain-containing protein [Palleronia pontilimi]MBJ3761177.1 Hint domain-containing protein [Palleronia pontilimi]